MENCRFFYVNEWDTATLTSSTSATNFPITNTQNRWKTYQWRSTSDTSQWIKCHATIPATGFFIFGHNFSPTATVTIQGSNNDFSTTPFSEPMIRGDECYIYVSSTVLTYDYYRININDPENLDDYVAVGRVWIGEAWTPTNGYNYQSLENPPTDPSVKSISGSGQVSVLRKTQYRSWNLFFDYISEPNKLSLFLWGVGISEPFIFIHKPKADPEWTDPENNCHYVRMSQSATKAPFSANSFKVSFKLEEER